MALNRVRLISRGMKSLLKDPGVARDLMERAERVADRARSTAPVDTGAYRDGISARADVTDRVVARVVATDRKSMALESRTGNLARALDSAGGS